MSECWTGRFHYDESGLAGEEVALLPLGSFFLLLSSSFHTQTSSSPFPKVSFPSSRWGIIAKGLHCARGLNFSRHILETEKTWSQWDGQGFQYAYFLWVSAFWLDKLPSIFIGKISLLLAWQNLCKWIAELFDSQQVHQYEAGEEKGGMLQVDSSLQLPESSEDQRNLRLTAQSLVTLLFY